MPRNPPRAMEFLEALRSLCLKHNATIAPDGVLRLIGDQPEELSQLTAGPYLTTAFVYSRTVKTKRVCERCRQARTTSPKNR